MIETRISTDDRRVSLRRFAPAPLSPMLAAYLGRLDELLPALDKSASQAALHALDALLANAQRAAPAVAALDDEPSLESARRRAALQHIERHLDAPQLSPAAVAASLGLSVRQLHRAFERSGQRSVSGEIRRLRIERARVLIETCRRVPITDIALQCGFASLASFYRAFKAEFGMTASQARSASRV